VATPRGLLPYPKSPTRAQGGDAKHEGEREGDGEEDVLVRDIGVDAAFSLQIPHFLTSTYITFYSSNTD
jgi:hypothetical protein